MYLQTAIIVIRLQTDDPFSLLYKKGVQTAKYHVENILSLRWNSENSYARVIDQA